MSTSFDRLEVAERDMAISLMVRVGLYVSQAEDVEGDHDDKKELEALECSLKHIAKMNELSAFVVMVAKQALARQKDWAHWARETKTTIEDCKKFTPVLHKKARKQDFKSYRIMLLRIAKAVALAYGEFEEVYVEPDLLTKLSGLFSSKPKQDDFENIAAGEAKALNEIKAALTLEKTKK